MQRVRNIQCFLCKASLYFNALYANSAWFDDAGERSLGRAGGAGGAQGRRGPGGAAARARAAGAGRARRRDGLGAGRRDRRRGLDFLGMVSTDLSANGWDKGAPHVTVVEDEENHLLFRSATPLSNVTRQFIRAEMVNPPGE